MTTARIRNEGMKVIEEKKEKKNAIKGYKTPSNSFHYLLLFKKEKRHPTSEERI